MKLISIQVGLPKDVEYQGQIVSTAIFKSPVAGPVQVGQFNIAGDQQADLRVHGGRDKAVYGYSLAAYSEWCKLRAQDDFPPGAMGENLSFDELNEREIHVGDVFTVGSDGCELQAVQPRQPCFKLGVKFADTTVIKQFMQLGRPGIYFRVLREGRICSGDVAKMVRKEGGEIVSVYDLFTMMSGASFTREQAAAMVEIDCLPEGWKKKLRKLLA